MLALTFQINLDQRMTLVQKLGLESEYISSFFVKTEAALKKRSSQKGLKLIKRFIDGNVEYRSVLDALLATAAPTWKAHIIHYYDHDGPRLGHSATWDQIQKMDEVLEAMVLQLAKSYREIKDMQCDDILVDGVVHFFGSHICRAPSPGTGILMPAMKSA